MTYALTPNPDEWHRLDVTDRYAAGHAWQRLEWLIQYDPYAVFLSEHTVKALCTALFGNVTGVLVNHDKTGEGGFKITDRSQVAYEVVRLLNESPLGKLLSGPMKYHLAELVVTAMFSGVDKTAPVG